MRNSDYRNCIPALAESGKQKYGYYNMNILGICLKANLPKWGTLLAHFVHFLVENKGRHNKEMSALVSFDRFGLKYYIERPNDRLGLNHSELV